MGYESKVMIVYEHKLNDYTWNEVKAVFDLGKMGYYDGWRELFDGEVDGGVYPILENDEIRIYCDDNEVDNRIIADCYGDTLKSATAKDVLEWCDINAMEYVKYGHMSFLMLYSALKELCLRNNCDEWKIYHYGY